MEINNSYAEFSGHYLMHASHYDFILLFHLAILSALCPNPSSVFSGSVTDLGSHLPWRPTRSMHAEAEIWILRIWCTPRDEHRFPCKELHGFESLEAFSVDKGKKLIISNHSSYFQRVFQLRDAHGKKAWKRRENFQSKDLPVLAH